MFTNDIFVDICIIGTILKDIGSVNRGNEGMFSNDDLTDEEFEEMISYHEEEQRSHWDSVKEQVFRDLQDELT